MNITLETHNKTVVLELPDDDHISNVFQRNQDWYEKAMLEDIYSRNLQGTAIDVGACFGTHSLWFAQVCGLSVIAIEPQDANYRVLLNNIQANKADVTALHTAVGARESYITLKQLLANNRGSNSGTPAHTGIPVVPIDSLGVSDVSLIKIDVEGMEMDVLEGARAVIRKWQPIIYVEAPHTYNAVKRFMRSFNYQEIGKWNATPTYGFMPRRIR